MLTDFMTVFEIFIPVRSGNLELSIKDKKFIACGDKDFVAYYNNAAKPAVSASTFKIDAAVIPVDDLLEAFRGQIDNIYAAMTVPLNRAAYD